MPFNEQVLKDFTFIQNAVTVFDYLLHIKCQVAAEASNEEMSAEGHVC